MNEIEVARKDFQAKLRKGAKRKTVETPKTKRKQPVSLEDLFDQLVKMQSLIKKGSGGAVKFVVTERDLNGKVKSFKVET